MDDTYAINAAKTEIREAYNTGDVERLMAVLDSGLVEYADGRQSGYGEGARAALRGHLQSLFSNYDVCLVPIVIEIKVMREYAIDYGWHETTLIPKAGGEPVFRKSRYLELWKRDSTGAWKLAMFMDNSDVADSAESLAA